LLTMDGSSSRRSNTSCFTTRSCYWLPALSLLLNGCGSVVSGHGEEGFPDQATNPVPPDGAVGVALEPSLSWSEDSNTTSYDVYVGKRRAAVEVATPGGDEYAGARVQPSFRPGALTPGRYFWRVDANNAAGTAKGDVWSFDTRCDSGGYCRLLDVGGPLTAAAWLDHDRMYVADYDGSIRLLDVESAEIDEVVEGLRIPQGLTVMDGRLYATDMGNVCDVLSLEGENPELCKRDIAGREVAFHSVAGARILSYRIGADGSLDDLRVLEDRILSRDRDYGPHGLINDGRYIYVSIGHPQGSADPEGFYVTHEEQLRADGGRTDLMGVVARFRPSEGEVEIEPFATGFRNIYGISMDESDGTIYGADNDDRFGAQREELNAIVEGGNYGYPYWATHHAPPEAGVTEPVAIVPGVASTVAYAAEQGVLVAFELEPQGHVIDRFDYATFTRSRFFEGASSYVTAILERDDLLYLVDLAGNIHVVEEADGIAPPR